MISVGRQQNAINNSWYILNIINSPLCWMQEIHVSKLPSSKYFTMSDIKQLLPMHQRSSIQNLKIIFNNYSLSTYLKHTVLLADQNLTLKPDSCTAYYYSYIKAVWCEDFDDSPDHLKNTLNMAADLANYIGSIDEDSPIEENEHDVPESNHVSRVQISAITSTGKVESRPKLYSQIKQEMTAIGFKFEKINGRIYMLIGVNYKTRESLALACAILRQWNRSRLKVHKTVYGIDIDLLHRICEHLFSMARGFIRDVSDDYNTYHAGLQKFIASIAQSDLGSDPSCQQKYKSNKLQPDGLPHEAIIMKCRVTFRSQHTQQNIWELLSEFVTQWILQTPLNASCSFASYMNLSESQRTFTLVLASHYQHSSKNKLPTVANVLQGVIQVQALLFDQTYKKAQENPLKASMVIFNKFQPAQPMSNSGQKTDFTLLRQLTPPDNSLNQSILSQVSNQSHHTSRKSISGSNNPNSTPSMKHIAKLQNRIYQILKTLDSKKKIYAPVQIQNIIRNYVRWVKKTQKNDGVPEAQYEVIRALNCINEEIEAEEVYLILKNNLSESNLILSYFLQKGKYSRAIDAGKKLANNSIQNLYKNCLKNGLINSRGTIIPFYLKKLVQAYSAVPNPGPKPLKIEEISIPQLVEILEKKSYDTHLYSSLLTVIFPQLFVGVQVEPTLKILAPLLGYFVQYLIKFDHHPELVFSFIADLLYEVCYFTTDTKLTMLSNSVYMQDRYAKNLTIKEKKVLEMVREGGLKGFGFEFKSMIMPIIEANKLYNGPQQLLYRVVRIDKPLELLHLFKVLSSCHYTATINKISKFLASKNNFTSTLEKASAPLICYLLLKTYQGVQHKLPDEKQMDRANEVQFQSITDRILRSESGIFQDIAKLNPNVKIAGVELRTAIKNLSNSRIGAKSGIIQERILMGRIDEEEAVAAYVPLTFQKDYEYVSLALSLKQRYLSYHTLSQIEKSYFKDCATTVVDHKKQILDYLAVSELASQLNTQIQ